MTPADIDRIAEKLAAMEQCYPHPWEWCWILMDPWRVVVTMGLAAAMTLCIVAISSVLARRP